MNKIKIYYAKIDYKYFDEMMDFYKDCLSYHIVKKIDSLKFKEDKMRSLYGEVLARYAIATYFNISNMDIIIERDLLGKPYVKNIEIEFNVSHSGDYVTCAIGRNRVGIDIEEIKDIDMSIAKSILHEGEYQYLMHKSEEEKLATFYVLWTQKESYLKWLGKGLTQDIKSFAVNPKYEEISRILNDKIFFKRCFIDDYYACMVCSDTNHFSETPEKIYLESIKIKNIFKGERK